MQRFKKAWHISGCSDLVGQGDANIQSSTINFALYLSPRSEHVMCHMTDSSVSLHSRCDADFVMPEERSVHSSTETSGAWCPWPLEKVWCLWELSWYGSVCQSCRWDLHFVEAMLFASATQGIEDWYSPLADQITPFSWPVDWSWWWVLSYSSYPIWWTLVAHLSPPSAPVATLYTSCHPLHQLSPSAPPTPNHSSEHSPFMLNPHLLNCWLPISHQLS